MRENRKCPFCGEKMICVNTQDGEFTCTSCAEYANHDVLDFIENLKADNERLKTELKKWEDRSKVVKDGYDGEVYEWEGNYYIVTPYLNVFVKGLLKENAKLKCLALHAMRELFYYKREYLEALPFYNDHEIENYLNLWAKFSDAYRKAKKDLMEGK